MIEILTHLLLNTPKTVTKFADLSEELRILKWGNQMLLNKDENDIRMSIFIVTITQAI